MSAHSSSISCISSLLRRKHLMWPKSQPLVLLSLVALLIALLSQPAAAECPNACSGHGDCSAFDACLCFKDWMASDCSQRVCPFGLAIVDTPKGNLDMSTSPLDDADTVVAVGSQMYPFGTTEQYPRVVTSADAPLQNSAHEYVECSGRGHCDRGSGQCVCIEGYEGPSCHRVSCPSYDGQMCSGHGTCSDARAFARRDHGNVYELWDRHAFQRCVCDPGYYGPLCDKRQCPVGYDPIYLGSSRRGSHRYPAWTYSLHVTDPSATIEGYYSIRLSDVFGETWVTDPIDYNATCAEVIAILESLPNGAVPNDSVQCTKADSAEIRSEDFVFPQTQSFYGIMYTLSFKMNPGKLEQIGIDMYLDGTRPSLHSSEPVGSFVFPAFGVRGETVDYFGDQCESVQFTLDSENSAAGDPNNWRVRGDWTVLGNLTDIETQRLKRCLGTSGGGPDNLKLTDTLLGSQFQWELGSLERPHLVRIVPLDGIYESSDLETLFTSKNIRTRPYGTSDAVVKDDMKPYYDKLYPGFFAVLIFDPSSKRFKLLNKYNLDMMAGGNPSTNFAIYTTTGELHLASKDARVVTSTYNPGLSEYSSSNSAGIRPLNPTNVNGLYDPYLYLIATPGSTNGLVFVDCESYKDYSGTVHGPMDKQTLRDLMKNVNCIEKGDNIFVFDATSGRQNPVHLNMYEVKRVHRQDRWDTNSGSVVELYLDAGANFYLNEHSNNAARAYIFRASRAASYEYVSECSGRGMCDVTTGICSCFSGYSGQSCSNQTSVVS